jgi:endo-1,4-beta-xylanase
MSRNRLITRRRALHLGLGTLATLGACSRNEFAKQTRQAQALDESVKNFIVEGNAPLKERAAAKGLIYGAAARKTELADVEFAHSFVENCGLVVPKWEFRWSWLNREPNSFNFTEADWFVQWAKTQKMLLRGHVLIYEKAMPKWFASDVNRQNVEQILLNYIETVASRYAGKMHSWDVVNEAINPEDGRPDGLRNTQLLQLLGPDYIELAFRAAAAADPNALLVYNENTLYADSDVGESRRIAVLKLLEHLKSKNTPIHALGMQGHIWNSNQLNQKKLGAFVREVANFGLKIMVTELDVLNQNQQHKNVELYDRLIAKAYEDYLSTVLDEPATIAVVTWGLSDRYSWYNKRKCGEVKRDKCKLRPLPLDDRMNRKLAWNAVARAFDNAPIR